MNKVGKNYQRAHLPSYQEKSPCSAGGHFSTLWSYLKCLEGGGKHAYTYMNSQAYPYIHILPLQAPTRTFWGAGYWNHEKLLWFSVPRITMEVTQEKIHWSNSGKDTCIVLLSSLCQRLAGCSPNPPPFLPEHTSRLHFWVFLQLGRQW